MCRGSKRDRRQRDRKGLRTGGSKIKGRGTRAPLTHCLHIGFGGTRVLERVPWMRLTPCLNLGFRVPHTPGYATA
jgi:hypothetical protein